MHRAQIAVSTLDMLEPRQDLDAAVAEIAMFYWTICTGIVQTQIANPSKRGAFLAIFNWTRQ